MSLRERGKSRRRAELVAAAAALWRKHGVDAVSVADVAAVAELSIPTIYNLVGGIGALKVAVVEEVLTRLEQVVAASSDVGVARSIFRARTSARLFLADPDLYRPLLVSIPRALFDGAQLTRDGSAFQRQALDEAKQLGELAPDIDVDPLAWQIHLQFLGGLMAWACGTLNGPGLLRATDLAVLAPLAACATPLVRARLDGELRALMRRDAAPGARSAS